MPCRPCQAKREALRKAAAERRFMDAAKVAVIGAGQMIGVIPKEAEESRGDDAGQDKTNE